MAQPENQADGVDVAETAGPVQTEVRPKPKEAPPRMLPPWKVLLHNDDVNEMEYVVETIVLLTPLVMTAAVQRMLEAHRTGLTLLLTTHRERAELYQQQFASRKLTVTIERAASGRDER